MVCGVYRARSEGSRVEQSGDRVDWCLFSRALTSPHCLADERLQPSTRCLLCIPCDLVLTKITKRRSSIRILVVISTTVSRVVLCFRPKGERRGLQLLRLRSRRTLHSETSERMR